MWKKLLSTLQHNTPGSKSFSKTTSLSDYDNVTSYPRIAALPTEIKSLIYKSEIYPTEAEKYYVTLLSCLYQVTKRAKESSVKDLCFDVIKEVFERDVLPGMSEKACNNISTGGKEEEEDDDENTLSPRDDENLNEDKKETDEEDEKSTEANGEAENKEQTPPSTSDTATEEKEKLIKVALLKPGVTTKSTDSPRAKRKKFSPFGTKKEKDVQKSFTASVMISTSTLTSVADIGYLVNSAQKSQQLKELEVQYIQKALGLFQEGDISPLYKNMELIGVGGFGEVYTATNKATGNKIALKFLKMDKETAVHRIANEIVMLESCKHENIVGFIGVHHFESNIWLAMEYCDGGTLLDLLKNYDLKERHMAFIMKSCVQALIYLHENNRIHRDLKAENILLDVNGVVKLADLGLCTQLGDWDSKGIAGSMYWMPPEMVKLRTYDTKVDIWGIGCITHELLTGMPVHGSYVPVKALFRTATRGAPKVIPSKKVSDELADFINKCLDRRPERRPTAKQLLDHPFLKKACQLKAMTKILRSVFMEQRLSQCNGI